MSKYYAIGILMLLLQCKAYAEVTLIHGFIPIVYNLSKCGDEERIV